MSKLILVTASILIGAMGTVKSQNLANVPIPTSAQLQWQNAELAALVRGDLHAHDGEFYVQSRDRINPVKDFNKFNRQK